MSLTSLNQKPSMMTDLPIPVIHSVADLRKQISHWRQDGLRIGMVPTMGALHRGHLALIEQAKKSCDYVVVSVFVNPTQFAPDEDFDQYPRSLENDVTKAASAGATIVFAPNASEMYPAGDTVRVTVPGIGNMLEGKFRPHFFTGVATVVSKLFLQAMPDAAFFGEKDYQQLQIIRRLVTDLMIPVEIYGVPTMRDKNGLALSSRNAYLNEKDMKLASQLNRVLAGIARDILIGTAPGPAAAKGAQALLDLGYDAVDYVAVINEDDFSFAENRYRPEEDQHYRVVAAVHLGDVRLIDNWPVHGDK